MEILAHPYTTQVISILDLGVCGKDMLKNWQLLEKQGIKIMLKEYPNLDLYQTIDDDLEMMEFVIKLVLLMENKKKEIVRQRQAYGIDEARRKGIKLGRRPLEIPKNFEHIYQRVQDKEMGIMEATKLLGVDYKTFKKWVKQYRRSE